MVIRRLHRIFDWFRVGNIMNRGTAGIAKATGRMMAKLSSSAYSILSNAPKSKSGLKYLNAVRTMISTK